MLHRYVSGIRKKSICHLIEYLENAGDPIVLSSLEETILEFLKVSWSFFGSILLSKTS